MSLFKKPSTKGSKKFQVACTAKDKQPLKILLLRRNAKNIVCLFTTTFFDAAGAQLI